jgi:hypothetical protein
MLRRTGITTALALIFALVAGVAWAQTLPPLPPWPYSDYTGGRPYMDCAPLLDGHPKSPEIGGYNYWVPIIPGPTTGLPATIPGQWCDNLLLAKWREPNCLRYTCPRKISCLLCIAIVGPEHVEANVARSHDGCVRWTCTRMRKLYPADPNQVISKPQ